MKITKKTVALALCLAIVFSSLIPIITFASDGPSSWAEEQVNAAIAENLVPLNLQSNFTQAITRAEFSALAVRLYETVKGEITGRTTFSDTNDPNVEKMAYMGVVQGVGNNRFNPNASLTRQEAAVMLSRLSDVLDHPFPWTRPRNIDAFVDMGDVSSWATEGVTRAQAAGVMGGVGDNYFAPNLPYTREQSIITMMRMLDIINEAPATLPEVPSGVENEIPGISGNHQPSYEVGRVVIIANETEHEPHSHFSHGVTRYMSASGPPLILRDVAQQLDEIEYTEDFEIVVDGEYAHSIMFSWYDSNYNLAYESSVIFVTPTEPGVYLLAVDVVWGDPATAATMMRYVFKIRV